MVTTADSRVMTVQGPVSGDTLGIALTHEHLFLDLRPSYAKPPETDEDRELASKPLSIEMLGAARRDFARVHDAMVLDDTELITEEVLDFKRLGGRTIVDVTGNGIHVPGFRPGAFKTLAERTGLNIVLACGYYVQATHPPEVAQRSVAELRESFLKEIQEGIGETEVRAGIIKVGVSQPVHPDEWKVLTAACETQKESGLPLSIHPYFGTRSRIAPQVARFVLHQGVDPERVNMCHMDGYMNLEYQRRVMHMGVWISFDTFGLENYYDSLDFNHNAHDSQREEFLIEHIALGYQDQIMLSHDICTKMQLRRFGGHGYGHILKHVVPSLEFEGVSREVVHTMLVENPRRFLCS